MRRTLIPLFVAFAGLLLAVASWPAAAQVSGRCKITCLSGRVIEGQVKELPGLYEVTIRPGLVVRVRKSEVFKIEPLERAGRPKKAAARPAAGASGRRRISEREIQEILGSEEVDIFLEDEEPAPDLMAPLETNQDSLEEMRRITGGGQVWETDHFLFVYTSTPALARELGSRLESVYRWCVRFMEILGIPLKRPEYRLEVYFFGTHDEYEAYQSNVGFVSMGAVGFYSPKNNRCAFFDMNTWPPIASLHERLKEPKLNYRRRRWIRNRIRRWVDHMNREVIQHEAGHQIHHNIGIFSRRADVNTWLVEGLTQQFETPLGKLGGSLGATNHYRLYQFRKLYGRKPKHFPNLRAFILDDSQWHGADSYPPAWALVHYLWKKKRDGFARYMREVAAREEDVKLSLTQKQQRFEDCFGKIDEKFEKDFLDYINSIVLVRSALPPTADNP